jgi:U6 snRNA-associated Sm-like protein LSm6
MNIALERCKEVAEGRTIRNWGDAFVRGNNGLPHPIFPTSSLLTLPIVTYICADNA